MNWQHVQVVPCLCSYVAGIGSSGPCDPSEDKAHLENWWINFLLIILFWSKKIHLILFIAEFNEWMNTPSAAQPFQIHILPSAHAQFCRGQT